MRAVDKKLRYNFPWPNIYLASYLPKELQEFIKNSLNFLITRLQCTP